VSPDSIDDHTLGLIASRVVIALREELEAIAVELGKSNGSESLLTVDDVAERLGVARSTVYAHWREWGGYKLGGGEKAASGSRRASCQPTVPPRRSVPATGVNPPPLAAIHVPPDARFFAGRRGFQ
jgi:hypothetical protein